MYARKKPFVVCRTFAPQPSRSHPAFCRLSGQQMISRKKLFVNRPRDSLSVEIAQRSRPFRLENAFRHLNT